MKKGERCIYLYEHQNLVEMENNSDVVQSYECLNASLVNMLRRWNYEVMPYEIFFLGEGFNFNIVQRGNVKHLECGIYLSSFRYMDKMDIHYIHDFLTDKLKAKIFLQNIISNSRFIAIKVRTDYLLYNRVYQQTVAKHYINVMGYDEEKNEIYIVDGDVPTMVPSSYAGWVKADDIIAGWQETDCEYIEYVYADCLKEVTYDQLANGVIKQVKDYLIEKSKEKGSGAVKALFEQLNAGELNELAEVAREINYQIRANGFLASREFLIDYLERFDDLYDLVQEEKAILKKWNSLCMTCIKVCYTKKSEEKSILVNKVLSIVQELLDSEKVVLQGVVDFLCSVH